MDGATDMDAGEATHRALSPHRNLRRCSSRTDMATVDTGEVTATRQSPCRSLRRCSFRRDTATAMVAAARSMDADTATASSLRRFRLPCLYRNRFRRPSRRRFRSKVMVTARRAALPDRTAKGKAMERGKAMKNLIAIAGLALVLAAGCNKQNTSP